MQQGRYVRLYADERGESHFEDVAIALVPGTLHHPRPLSTLPSFSRQRKVGGLGHRLDGTERSHI